MKYQLMRMTGITLGCATASIFASTATAQVHSPRVDSNGIAGAWRLISLERPGPEGQLHRVDCTGMLVATRDGHFSVQVMDRGPQVDANSAADQYSQGGYEASFGTYLADERAHTFTFHVEGAVVRNLIGKDLPRAYELSGNQLIVRSAHAEEHWRVTWERYQ